MRCRFSACGEFRDRAARSRFRRLAAGVGINLGVEHQHVHVAAARQHVVEAAVADVVSPAVAADDPDALFHQHVGEGEKLLCFAECYAAVKRFLQKLATRSRCREMSASSFCWAVSSAVGEFFANLPAEPLHQFARKLRLLVDGDAEAQTELGVVFKQRVRPCRTAALGILASTAWSAGCRRRSTSIRWRWQ